MQRTFYKQIKDVYKDNCKDVVVRMAAKGHGGMVVIVETWRCSEVEGDIPTYHSMMVDFDSNLEMIEDYIVNFNQDSAERFIHSLKFQ